MLQSSCEHTWPEARLCSMFSGNTWWNRVTLHSALATSRPVCSSSQLKALQGPRSVAEGVTVGVHASGLASALCRANFCCFPFYFTKQKTDNCCIVKSFLASVRKSTATSALLEVRLWDVPSKLL